MSSQGKLLASVAVAGIAIAAFIYLRAPDGGMAEAPPAPGARGGVATTASLGPAAVTGTVSSEAEGPMEGVLVTLKRNGSTMATTVVSGAGGTYTFPASYVGPGHYTLTVRATGYVLDGPAEVDVASGQVTRADVRLNTTDDIASQLTNAEWLMSMPGTDEEKRFLGSCQNCHTLQRVVKTTYDAEILKEVVPRMGRYYPGSTPERPQVLPPGPRDNRGITNPEAVERAANYIARVNLSGGRETWDYELKTLPRPTGRATSVIYTTYDLPRPEAMPHDAIVVNGKVYYSDFGSLYIGELDPVTGEVTDYALPVMKDTAPRGTLGLHADNDGNLWVAMMYQGGLVRFNTTTKEITAYPLPAEWQNGSTQQSMVSPRNSHVDGKVWTNDQWDHTFLRLDVATGTYEKFPVLRDQSGETINGYEIPSDSENNIWPLEMGGAGTRIGRVDGDTKTLSTWRPPFPRAQARRGQFDEDGVLWFAMFGANAVGRFDPETEQMQSWVLPTPWFMPYDAVRDGRGEVWTGAMGPDRIARLNPETGEVVEYLLPEYTNVRRVFFDDDTRSFWVGANHENRIVRLQPLD